MLAACLNVYLMADQMVKRLSEKAENTVKSTNLRERYRERLRKKI